MKLFPSTDTVLAGLQGTFQFILQHLIYLVHTPTIFLLSLKYKYKIPALGNMQKNTSYVRKICSFREIIYKHPIYAQYLRTFFQMLKCFENYEMYDKQH